MNTWEGHLADTLSLLERDLVAEVHTVLPPLHSNKAERDAWDARHLPDDEDDIARPVAVSACALAEELRVGKEYASRLLNFLVSEGRVTPLKAKGGVVVYKRQEEGDEAFGSANVTVILHPEDGRDAERTPSRWPLARRSKPALALGTQLGRANA